LYLKIKAAGFHVYIIDRLKINRILVQHLVILEAVRFSKFHNLLFWLTHSSVFWIVLELHNCKPLLFTAKVTSQDAGDLTREILFRPLT